MTISDTLKAKIDELDLERRITEATAQAETAVVTALGRLGNVAHERHDELEGYLTKAQAFVDERTHGKYADTVVKVREQASRGLTRLADERHRADESTGDAPTGEEPTTWGEGTDRI